MSITTQLTLQKVLEKKLLKKREKEYKLLLLLKRN
jgi:hypothetical protein